MPIIRKRKQIQLHHHQESSSSKNPKSKSARITSSAVEITKSDPFPTHLRPTPEECLAVRNDLLNLHGFPQEFAKYRKQRQSCNALESEVLDEEESVLDGLVKTVLSQNTTDVNCQRAFASLKSAFPTWEDVLAAEATCIENAIRCGGLAPTKTSCIKNILSSLLKKTGKLCLEYLRDLPINKIKDELSNFKGIGPKTVACVLMFHLQQDDFPVDTHVFNISKTIGWIPAVADRNKAYLHLNQRIPNQLKFDLNCLLFTHGKLCHKCAKNGGKQLRKEPHDNSCPLLNYCNNS